MLQAATSNAIEIATSSRGLNWLSSTASLHPVRYELFVSPIAYTHVP